MNRQTVVQFSRPKGVSLWLALFILMVCWVTSFGFFGASSSDTILVVTLVAGGVIVASIIGMARHSRRVAADTLRWRKAMQRWSELYYCARDDGLFNPAEGEFIPLSQLEDYLYREEPLETA